MNRKEINIFRWLCKQADYNYKDTGIKEIQMPVWKQTPNGRELSAWQPGTVVTIYFSKTIVELVAKYDVKTGTNAKESVAICNRWLREGLLIKDLNYEDISKKYYITIAVPSRFNKYFNIIPYRVMSHLNRLDGKDSILYQPSYDAFEKPIPALEKMYLRYIMRHCYEITYDDQGYDNIIKPVNYGFYLKIDDDNYRSLKEDFINNGDYSCSKNHIKKIERKLKCKGILTFVTSNTDNGNYEIISIESPTNDKYIKIIPEEIYRFGAACNTTRELAHTMDNESEKV